MGVEGIDNQTQLSRPLLLSCRIRLPCVDKVYTRAQAEPGPVYTTAAESSRAAPNQPTCDSVHLLAVIAPPHIRRTVAVAMNAHDKRQTTDTN